MEYPAHITKGDNVYYIPVEKSIELSIVLRENGIKTKV